MSAQAVGLQPAPRQVFVSYASPDAKLAAELCSALEGAGVCCWIAPRDVAPGAVWAASIDQAIEAASILLLVFTRSANASPYVLRELTLAEKRRRLLIAVRADGTLPSGAMDFFLATVQWLDLEAQGVAVIAQRVGFSLREGSDGRRNAFRWAAAGVVDAARDVRRTWKSYRAPFGFALILAVALSWFLSRWAQEFFPPPGLGANLILFLMSLVVGLSVSHLWWQWKRWKGRRFYGRKFVDIDLRYPPRGEGDSGAENHPVQGVEGHR